MDPANQMRDDSRNKEHGVRKTCTLGYLAKSELAAQIQKLIEVRQVKQADIGKLLGINQPKVLALLNGRLDGFSTDRLFRFLTKLGCDIQINISCPHPQSLGHIYVLAS